MEYAPFGIDISESRARFDEAAAMIVAALESGWISGDGPYYPQAKTVTCSTIAAKYPPRLGVHRR
jgi:hypothetical protein